MRFLALLALQLIPGLLFGAPGTISGRVVGRNGEPASAFISAVTATGRFEHVRSALTDKTGQFRLTDLPPGSYHVVAGYEDVRIFYPGVLEPSKAKTIEVNDGKDTLLGDFAGKLNLVMGRVKVEGNGALPPLSLTLTDEVGEMVVVNPAVGASGLFGLRLPDRDWKVNWNSSVPLPEGYSLKSLTHGRANLLVEPLREARARAASNSLDELRVDLSASRKSWAKVTGKFSGVDVKARQYHALLKPAANEPSLVLLKAPVGLNGQFEFPRVLNGTYTLTFVSNGGIPVSQSVVVMGANVVANLTAPPHKEVAGRAMVEGFAGEFVFGIALRRQGEPEATIIVFPQANGKFRVALPLGESELSVVSGQADSFTYGATDLQRESLTIRAQDNAGELTIRLKRQQPQVSGNDVDDRLGLASLLGLPQTPTVSRETVFLPAEGITPPQPIKTPNPGYSEWARKARFSGVLTMELIVDVDGNARVVRVIQSIGYGLDESAIATVEAWKFRPATRNGQPVAVRMKMAVTFRLL